MEISLNLLWLAVAVIAASVWIFRWRPASRDSALSAAVALGCALVLLFPSISLTDDLHPQIVAVDAAAGKRNTCQLISSAGCKVSSAAGVASRLAAHLVAVVAQALLLPGRLPFGGIVADKTPIDSGANRNPLPGRSPPLLSVL